MQLKDSQKRKLKELAPYFNASHFFAVKNVSRDDTHWTFCNGECADAMIISGDHELVYMGPQRDFVDPKVPVDDLTPAQKEVRAKMQVYLKRQTEDLANLKRKADERVGIYAPVSASSQSEG